MYLPIGSKLKDKSCYGIVLYGAVIVGTFDYQTSEDCFSKRQLFNLSLKNEFVSVPNRNSQELRFMFVEKLQNDKPYKLVEDLGLGVVQGSFYVSDAFVTFAEATFSKSPKNELMN